MLELLHLWNNVGPSLIFIGVKLNILSFTKFPISDGCPASDFNITCLWTVAYTNHKKQTNYISVPVGLYILLN